MDKTDNAVVQYDGGLGDKLTQHAWMEFANDQDIPHDHADETVFKCGFNAGSNTAADQSRVIEVMRTALEATARASRQTLDIIQKENFVFDGSGDRWEKLAFTIYTELTQASTDAKDALAEAQRIQESE